MVFAFYAPVVKLAYTLDSGSSGLTAVEVQLLSGAPFQRSTVPCNTLYNLVNGEVEIII